ncbi:MAG: nitroreductase [Syntrophales bacterium]|nr:nitroreductase [Syntrophales bacterium]
MTVTEAVMKRRSIRKFKGNVEVPKQVLKEIVDIARWSPSWGNTQPWEFYILSGKPLNDLREQHREYVKRGTPISPEISMPEVWPEHIRRRYTEVGRAVLTALDISREDREKRLMYYEEMASFFGAPHLMVVCIHAGVAVEYALLDVGIVTQTICLLAWERGIGSCVMASAVCYPELIRRFAPIPEDRRIVVAIALGYGDSEAPVNKFNRSRVSLDEILIWVEG